MHSSIGSRSKLRLLLVITRLTVGGDTNVVLDIARFFQNHPHIQADIAAGPVGKDEIDLAPLAGRLGIALFIIPTLSNRPNPLLMARAILDLRRVLRRGHYDLVHTHSSAAGILGRLAAVLAGVPVTIHHVHGWGLHEGMPKFLQRLYISLERLCALFTDRLVAVSAPTIMKGRSHHICSETKFRLIYNGIDVERFQRAVDVNRMHLQLGTDPSCQLVGMIGRLDRQKNPLDFIRAAAMVRRQFPNAQFLIAGDGSLRDACEQLICELHLEGRCILLGYRDDIANILPLLSIVVCTSLWEGLPVAFQEAMCAGKPIVSYDVDGVSDVVRHGKTGYLVPPHNVDELSSRILQLLADDHERSELGNCARAMSEGFSRQYMLEQIQNLYLQTASSRIPFLARAEGQQACT